MELTFRPATANDAVFISRGLHMALLISDASEERIRLFGETVCCRDDVLYSARNSTIAMVDGKEVGLITAYAGGRYKEMRQNTMPLMKELFGTDYADMEDESVEGEYYIDSLAVLPEYRQHGIGRALLRQAIRDGQQQGLTVTLAVDPDNAGAQKLYKSLGFTHQRDIYIFGHTYWKWEVK